MRSATEIKGFGLTAEHLKLNRNSDFTVVIEPNALSEHKGPLVWGILPNSKFQWALEHKAPITPKMCQPPGVPTALVLAPKPEPSAVELPPPPSSTTHKIPRGSEHWKLNTSEPAPVEVHQSFMRLAIETRIRNWSGKPSDALYLVNDFDVLMETQSFWFMLTVVATANRLRQPEWSELADIFLKQELKLLRLRLTTSFKDQLTRLYPIAARITQPLQEATAHELEEKLVSDLSPEDKDDNQDTRAEKRKAVQDVKEWIQRNYPPGQRILKVPFEHCLWCLRQRRIAVHQGLAYITQDKLQSTICDFMRTRIKQCVAEGIQESRRGRVGPWANERCRELIQLVRRALLQLQPGGSTQLPKDVLVKSAAEYEAFMNTRAPPCMLQMYNRHVPNKGRLVFINFTARMGIPRQFVIGQWRAAFQAHWQSRSEAEWKSLNGEFDWAERKGARKKVTCNQMAQNGLCPFMKGPASALTLEARNFCTKHQKLTGDAQFALLPVMRVKTAQPTLTLSLT